MEELAAFNRKTKVRFFPGELNKVSNISGCSTDGYMGWFWKPVFAGSNPENLQIFDLPKFSSMHESVWL
jgi:hypothetical protein